jgi:hypothetical protein
VYGGTFWDVKSSCWTAGAAFQAENLGEATYLALVSAFFLVDLPFSAIGDTLTLYLTIPATVQRWTAPVDQLEPAPTPGSNSSKQDDEAENGPA